MKKLLITSVILLTSFNLSFAQSNDSYKSTLRKMLQTAGTEATFSTMVKQMFTMFKQQKSNVPESTWIEIEKEFSQTSLDDLVNMFAPIYQKHFTEADLRKLIEFYQSPIGRKLAEKTPLITQESMQVGQEWGKKLGEQFHEKLKAKGYN